MMIEVWKSSHIKLQKMHIMHLYSQRGVKHLLTIIWFNVLMTVWADKIPSQMEV